MNVIYFNIVQYIIVIIAIIRLKFNSFKKDNQYDKNIYEHIIFNGMIIPLVIYSTIGHLIFSNKVAKSIGWKKSPFQKELGYFTLSLLLVMIWSNYTNTKLETKIALSYVWIIFILLAAFNHIYEFSKGNHSWNNIFPIFVSIIVIMLYICQNSFYATQLYHIF
jgi:cell division protein FtsW (lipid II flippase)